MLDLLIVEQYMVADHVVIEHLPSRSVYNLQHHGCAYIFYIENVNTMPIIDNNFKFYIKVESRWQMPFAGHSVVEKKPFN
jgi:hypothetical protein